LWRNRVIIWRNYWTSL